MQPRAQRFGNKNPLARLQQFAQAKPQAQPVEVEHCELCSVPLALQHRHLLEMETRQVVCSCDPCALRFQLVVDGRFKLIPRDARALPGFHMTDGQWDSLSLPIDLAFFLYSSTAEKMVAYYPSPGGVTESLLPLDAWETLVADNPALGEMEPDVEALLVNRVKQSRQYFLAPIDTCYRLVGLVRVHWRGFSGGYTIWDEIEQFFTHLENTARPISSTSHSAPRNSFGNGYAISHSALDDA